MADYSSYKIPLGYTGDWSVEQYAHIDATEAVATAVEGMGTAATYNTGTSGSTVPLLSGANTWGAAQYLQLGAQGTPSLAFTGDTNTGLWSPAADTIAVSTGGVVKIRIAGNVLVGTSTDIGDAVYVAGDVAAGNFKIGTMATGAAGTFGFTNTNGSAMQCYGTATGGAGELRLLTAGIPRLRISHTTGAVGINIAPKDSSSSLLYMGGDITLGSANSYLMGNLYYASGWKHSGTGYGGALAFGTGGSKALEFFVASDTSTADSVATVFSAACISNVGNLLINTSTDDGVSKLQVNGNVTIVPPASATPASNGQMTFELTNNTTLKIKVKGSDGVVRSTTLTLA